MSFKNAPWKLFFIVAALCALASEFFQHVVKQTEAGRIEYARKKIFDLEMEMQSSLEMISAFSSDSQVHAFFIHSGQQEKGFSFFSFENDKIGRAHV